MDKKATLLVLKAAIEKRQEQIMAIVDMDEERENELMSTVNIWIEVVETLEAGETLYTKENTPIGMWFHLYEAFGLMRVEAPFWLDGVELTNDYWEIWEQC